MIRALASAALLVSVTACSGADVRPSPSLMPATSPSVRPTAKPTREPSVSASPSATAEAPLAFEMEAYPVVAGSRPHDVAPASDGGVWYTGQGNGTLGWLDPETGDVREISLGPGSSPHGVITGPEGDAWVTDGGLNAVVRIDADTDEITTYPVPVPNTNLNTGTFDGDGIFWFTGQGGVYGSVDPVTGEVDVRSAPGGAGPYGIAATPEGEVYFGSLAGNYLGAIDRATGEVAVIDTPTAGGGARRVWADSEGRLWITEWFSGDLAMYDPRSRSWTEWPLPGEGPMPYAVYVDELDAVWVTDFGSNAILRFDPATEEWISFPHAAPAEVRQLLGRPGEIWGAESAADRLVVIRSGR